MKKEQRVLTYPQAKELKWFCENVTGLHPELYKMRGQVDKFSERIARLEKTSEMIEKFFAEFEVKTAQTEEPK